MPKEEVPLLQLKSYLPEGSFENVVHYLQHYKVHLTVTRQRQSILGDYRHAYNGKTHRISVNGNLNNYSFLITLLHELAHLFTYERYGHRVQAHGKEWKHEFSQILAAFLEKNIFPPDVEMALRQTLHNPAATSCGDEHLLRVLRKYDKNPLGLQMVEQLPAGSHFSIKGGRMFKKGAKQRTRYQCTEIATGKLYLFSGLYEVKAMAGEQ